MTFTCLLKYSMLSNGCARSGWWERTGFMFSQPLGSSSPSFHSAKPSPPPEELLDAGVGFSCLANAAFLFLLLLRSSSAILSASASRDEALSLVDPSLALF